MSRERLIPSGVQMLAWTRTIRYVGWGFGESLIPILIMSLTGSFAEAGLIRSTYDVSMLLALPVIGLLAERYPAKWLVVAGLCIYPFVGLGYFLAGTTGALLFIVLARAANGISWGLDSTGIDTYYRRMTPSGSLASSFGFLDTLSNIGWIAAALAGIVLVRFVPVHILLFIVAPTSLLALPVALATRRDHPALGHGNRRLPLRQAYRSAIEKWGRWQLDLRLLALLLLFTDMVAVLIDFFVPIDIYLSSHNLTLVILFSVVATVPYLFGYLLGKVADRHDNTRLAALACGAMTLVLIALSLPIPYSLTVLGGLMLGVLLELLSIVQKTLATRLTPAEHYGRLDSVFQIIGGISDLAAPIVLGVALDMLGFPIVASMLAGIALLLALIFILNTHPRHAPHGAALAIPAPDHTV